MHDLISPFRNGSSNVPETLGCGILWIINQDPTVFSSMTVNLNQNFMIMFDQI